MKHNNELVLFRKKKKKIGIVFIPILFLISTGITAGVFIENNRIMTNNTYHEENNLNEKIYSGDLIKEDINKNNTSQLVSNETETDKNLDNQVISNENINKPNNDNQMINEENVHIEENNVDETIINDNEISGDNDNIDNNIDEKISGDIVSGENQNNIEENNVVGETKIRELDPNKPMVAFTFDDGPDPKRSLQIIETFQEYDSLATFFDIGYLMERYPDTVKKEVEAGFEVGGHTYSHSNLNKLSKEEIQNEITKMEDVYKNITGLDLKYIRPPYGNANDVVKGAVSHPLINWNVDTLDWKSRNADKVVAEVKKIKNLDGKIILMHSIYGSTVDAVKRLVPELVEEGYQLVTVSELAYYKGYNLENGKVYYGFK